MSVIIQLLHDYGGERTRERRIAPGFYAADDPVLFGLADYLIANGHAVVASITTNSAVMTAPAVSSPPGFEIKAPSIAAPDGFEIVAPGEAITPEDARAANAAAYEALTVEELRAECARREIDLEAIRGTGKDGKLLKADLVFILQGDDDDMQTLHFEGRLIHAAPGEE